MNEKLKTIENIAELLYAELKSCVNSNNLELDSKAYGLLKEAMIDAIDTKRKIEIARAWHLSAKRNSQ